MPRGSVFLLFSVFVDQFHLATINVAVVGRRVGVVWCVIYPQRVADFRAEARTIQGSTGWQRGLKP